MTRPVTFDRPVKATLMVALENGETWEAGPEDLAQFGLADKHKLYARAHDMLCDGLGVSDSNEFTAAAQAVRYLMECAINYTWSPWAREDGTPWDEEDAAEGVRVQATLRAALG